MTKDEITGWHHGLTGHEFEQLPEMGKDREASPQAVFHEAAKSRLQPNY